MVVAAALTGSATAANRFVAPAGSDEGGNDCLSAAAPCQTVQRGIEEAAAGDTVSIAAGTFQGAFKVDKPLRLVGEGSSTLLEGEPDTRYAVDLTADATLENLRMRGGLTNSEFGWDAGCLCGTGIEVAFDDVTAEQDPGSAEGHNVFVVGAGNRLTMTDSTVTGIGTTSLWVDGSATVTDSDITTTPTNRTGVGVYVGEHATVDVAGSNIIAVPGTWAVTGSPALMSDGGTVVATDSTFRGPRGFEGGNGTALLERDMIEGEKIGVWSQAGESLTLRDSLVAPAPDGSLETAVLVQPGSPTAPLTIVGSTVYAGFRAVHAEGGEGIAQVQIANSILDAGGQAGEDLSGEDATWSISHSDFTKVYASQGAIPMPGSGSNISWAPTFAGQAAGDYQLTDSDGPLLGSGDPAQVVQGETDLAGRPRVPAGVCDGAPDIGAYELMRAESCPVSPAGGVGQTPQNSEPAVPAAATAKAPAAPTIVGAKLKKRRRGPTLEFSLSEPATITVTIARAVSHGSGKHATRSYRPLARFDQAAGEGAATIPLASHLRSGELIPGAYRVTLVATADGLRSATRTLPAFEIFKK